MVGKILLGIYVDNMTYRFTIDDYISTSKIIEISPHSKLIKAISGSIYQVVGVGPKSSSANKRLRTPWPRFQSSTG